MREKTGWTEYPRPQLQRESFLCLNGVWKFCVTKTEEPPQNFSREIMVPYPVESELSGVGEHFAKGSFLWYRRFFCLPEGFRRDRVLLNCGGIDQKAWILVNGKPAGEFCTAVEGPICCDITELLREGENELSIRVQDDLDVRIPYGKQKEKRGGMWYTPFSGIWQTVWLESVPKNHIERIRIVPGTESVRIEVTGTGVSEGTVECEGISCPLRDGKAVIRPAEFRLWTPELPYLYYFSIRAGEDEVFSYFALRTLEIREVNGLPRLCLNGAPFFFHGILDQGYFPKGICTPEEPSAYKWDILAMKRMGFNMLRKHIKVEPEEFYYECDRIGMIVFQDMVNNGTYHFFRDTALPTVGVVKLSDENRNPDLKARENFLQAMRSTVRHLENHPCICAWTIFNEGWGQFASDRAYEELKKLDPTRFVDSTSGWFAGKKSDVLSMHVYFRTFRMPARSERPVILSEFGGYSLKIPEHSWNKEKNYGYRFFQDPEKYMQALEKLYMEEIIPSVKQGLCGAVYTQTADVEDETNGLITYDRCQIKVREDKMRAIADLLAAAMQSGSCQEKS